jgi:hypothetical protein
MSFLFGLTAGKPTVSTGPDYRGDVTGNIVVAGIVDIYKAHVYLHPARE